MNALSSSFYDSLNKFVIGFLLLLPIVDIYYLSITLGKDSYMFENEIYIFAFGVLSWVIGLLFWMVIEVVVNKYMGVIPCYKNNNIKWINEIYAYVCKNTNMMYEDKNGTKISTLSLADYYKVYYEVQKANLLGNVSNLESFSAFFRNLTFVLPWWILVILTHWWHPLKYPYGPYNEPYTPEEMTAAIMIILIVLILSLLGRIVVEKKIFRCIFDAYFLGCK